VEGSDYGLITENDEAAVTLWTSTWDVLDSNLGLDKGFIKTCLGFPHPLQVNSLKYLDYEIFQFLLYIIPRSVTDWIAEESGFDSRKGAVDIFFSTKFRPALRHSYLMCTEEYFSTVKSAGA
jgi:hypothetical protein